ncbi:MAG: hypothetical protein FWH06_06935, partial [Oscillospiraceae bacterium]|nr:hypothetical protein [Oscillospiraceae bacterium]
AYRLEQAGRERNIDLITACAPEFHKQLRGLLEKLQPGSAADGADEDIGGLLERLLRIQEMCADYNRKGALDILQEIEQENCSKETREVLGGITELILHSEFDEAEKAVGDYASGMCSGHRAGAARMREIAGIDIEKGLERYGGDMETYLKILRSYTVCIRSMLGQIETVGEDTLADYKVIVHGIKGASRDIFAEQVGASAAELEQAAKAGDLGYITGHNPPFLEAAWKLIGDLESVLSASAGENQKPKKDKPDAETLSKLLAACEKYDMDGADAAMEEIGRCQYEADGGLADWLRDNVSLMNFTQIIERLSALDK